MRRAVLALLLTTGLLSAQGRTWIVDASNGPGTNFTDLPAAEAAASPGDILVVRAGTYSLLQTSKGLTILGEGGVTTGTIFVSGLPAGQRMTIANVTVPSGPFGGIVVTGAQGTVHLHDVVIPAALVFSPGHGVFVRQSALVTVTGGELWGAPAIRAEDATVTVAGARVTGASSTSWLGGNVTPSGSALIAVRSNVIAARSTLTGGNGRASLFLTYEGQPALLATDSDVVVTGDGTTALTAGQRVPNGTPAAAIDANGGTLTIDTTVRLTGFNAPPVVGTAARTWTRVVSMLAAGGARGGPLTLEVVCPYGSLVSMLAGVPAPPTALPFGTLFLDAATMFDAVIRFQDPSEHVTVTLTVPNDPALRGVVIGFQAFQWDLLQGELQLSNPAVVALR